MFFILILYGIAGFTLTVTFLKESEVAYAIFYGMYVVETAIPPLIPTVFLVSVGISAERLLWKRIACADNREILVTGKVKMAFFDKTGTLVSRTIVTLWSRLYEVEPATLTPFQIFAVVLFCRRIKVLISFLSTSFTMGSSLVHLKTHKLSIGGWPCVTH